MEALILNPDSAPLSRNIEDYPDGIIIPIDKPYRWTSADVIRKVKYAAIRHFGKKNLKVGHAGTLDPLATGVLLVCIGKATKLAEELQSHDKEYVACITFGATTPSYDLEKDIDRFFPHEHIDSAALESALPGFIGEQDQIAPLFSAKSVDGVRAYELARKLYRSNGGSDSGFDAAAESLIRVAKINISELELLDFKRFLTTDTDLHLRPAEGERRTEGEDRATPLAAGEWAHDEGVGGVVFHPTLSDASSRINVTDNSALGLPRAVIRMTCSKGTYVRAFARDLGEALGSGAHLDSLQRSRSGIFRVEDALSIDQAVKLLQPPCPANN